MIALASLFTAVTRQDPNLQLRLVLGRIIEAAAAVLSLPVVLGHINRTHL
jgi:hypothetical protein